MKHIIKGNAQLAKNTTFKLWEKMMAQLRKMFCKIPMNACAAISVMLLCSFVYAEVLLHFEGWWEIFFKLEYFLMRVING